jgi:hypothetical protein
MNLPFDGLPAAEFILSDVERLKAGRASCIGTLEHCKFLRNTWTHIMEVNPHA